MWGRIKALKSRNKGATLVEFSLVLPILFLLIFGIIDFGYILYQYNVAVKSTQIGAQYAATHDSVISGLNDCGPSNYSAPAGTDCALVAGYNASWQITCPGGAGCQAGIMTDITTKMQEIYPNLDPSTVRVTFSGEPGLGYIGRGRPVPAITVSIENMQYRYVAIGAFVNWVSNDDGFGSSINISSARTTVIAEDLREGT